METDQVAVNAHCAGARFGRAYQYFCDFFVAIKQRILAACLTFVLIIAVVGGLAQQQTERLGHLAISIYDHTLTGIIYADQTQEEFLRLVGTARNGQADAPAKLQKVLDRLDVAIERAGSERARDAGRQVRALLVSPPSLAADAESERMAMTDLAISRFVKKFVADGLQARDEAEALAEQSIHIVLVEVASGIVFALTVGWLVGRNLSRPLLRLVRSIRRLADGELDHEVAVELRNRRDEIGEVARATAVFAQAMRQNARTREERERAQREAERRHNAVLELKRMRLLSNLSREILIIHRDGLILQVNAAACRVIGVGDAELVGRQILNLIRESDHAAIMRCMQRPEEELSHEEINLMTNSGAQIPVEFASATIDYEGTPATVVLLRDLTKQKRDEGKIRHLAHHDALTDLPNRFLLHERLTHALELGQRAGDTPAMLCLDLDRFKPVNDLLGHAAGDALLIQVARRLQAEIRASDTLARVGGDEFVIVAMVEDQASVANLAARLISALTTPFDLNGHRVEIGTSIGIALYPRDGVNQETLLHAADTALYRAKHEQRGTFRFFEAAMNERLLVRRRLEHDLRRAVELEQFYLIYQPIFNCFNGEVEGFEALLRWCHPDHGEVLPMDFLPLAEEAGLIGSIGRWVIESACQAAAAWTEPYRLAINISATQFRQADLPDFIASVLARCRLPASQLEIEITELALIEDAKRAAEVLSALQAIGVSISLDDFGTNYSSLSYLHAFKFDKLKLDASFTLRLGEVDDTTTIVRATIGLAHILGLKLVAEGVETPAQLAILRDMKCDQVQGYWLGRPMRIDDYALLMASRGKMSLDSIAG